MKEVFNFSGKNVLITGAGSGIGRALAIAMIEAGAKVCIVGRRIEKLEETKNLMPCNNEQCYCYSADITKEAEVDALLYFLTENLGAVDVLINCAGLANPLSVEESLTDEWSKQIDTNLNATAYISGQVIPNMKKNKYGRIINIASVNALVASKTLARHAYNASKAGVCGLTRGMSSTYAKDGITVNAVCPGLFESEMTKDIMENKVVVATYNKQIPIARFGKLEEVVYPIMFLASDIASYITGQCIAIDGGMTTSSYI